MRVEIDRPSLKSGDPLTVTVRDAPKLPFDHLQVDIYTAGTLNAELACGMGSAAVLCGDESYTLKVDTQHLKDGYYEICHLRLTKSPVGLHEMQPEHVAIWARQMHQRICFEVIDTPREIAVGVVADEVNRRDHQIEYDFLKPVSAVLGTAMPIGNMFTVFVFVRRLLIGSRMRFSHSEVVPVKDAIDANDELKAVNDFMRKSTKVSAVLSYSPEAIAQNKQANPVCVFHYPAVFAQDSAQACTYASDQTQSALLAFSLSRGASGEIFSIVVVERGGSVVSYTPPSRYVGNLLTGFLTGESADQVESMTRQLKNDGFDRFLVALYKEALREPSADFQYVRFWQVLEVLAEVKNYDEKLPLLGYSGEPLMDGDQPITMKSSPAIVFALLRDSGFGTTEKKWKSVNVWFAFRNAVAHHGAISKFHLLSRPTVRCWAEQGYPEIKDGGHDHYLWELKEDTKMLLMCRLNRSPPFA